MCKGPNSLYHCNGDDWQWYSYSIFIILFKCLQHCRRCVDIYSSIIGASAYFKSKWMEFDTRANSVITDKVNEIGAKISNKQDKDK